MALVLYIDNDSENLALIEELLSRSEHEVISCSDGYQGLSQASINQPDLVILDTDIPELDGYAVTYRLRRIPSLKGVPIVCLSATGDRETILAYGANGYIQKPINPETLSSLIERYLQGYCEYSESHLPEKTTSGSQRILERLENKVVELSEVNRRREEMARKRKEFLRNISHEFATPMTPVVGYLRLLLNEEMGPLTPLQRKCLESINTSTQKLRALVDTLLDVSGLEMGRLHLYERDYDFAELVNNAISEMDGLLAQSDISFVRENQDERLPARGDPDKLYRAMMHILDNAVKFTPRGGEVAVGIRKKMVKSKDEMYQFVVLDNGPGISVEESKKILEPFYQVDGSPTRSYGGVGLGLAFARYIAEAMGGNIEVQSPPTISVAGRELGGTAICLTVKKNPVIGQEHMSL